MDIEKSYVGKAKENIRISGFLEKKGKMKLMSSWRKYWFVLEERLLLYYRSEVEYTNLSPCRGSINMGLVTSVRPGPSTGPCTIHVITRTQAVQLRAKDRATQEQWLQALLHSMSLPSVPLKPFKLPILQASIGYTSSLDSVVFDKKFKESNLDNKWTLPRRFDYQTRQISGSYFGGSLDTAIWTKKFKPPTSNIPKGRMLEKILGFSNENDSLSLVVSPRKGSCLSLINEKEMKYIEENLREEIDEVCENEKTDKKCQVHDENRNHDYSENINADFNKHKKRMTKTYSDTQLNQIGIIRSFEESKAEKKEASAFERLRNLLTVPKDKMKMKFDDDKTRVVRKRRQSFLQKVFKRKGEEIQEYISDASDSLYDTINNTEGLTQSNRNKERKSEEKIEEVIEERIENSKSSNDISYAEVKKTVVGSRILLPTQTMSELKTKLKTRESLEKQELPFLDDPEDTNNESDESVNSKKERNESSVPSLPPRRISRPVSPWHDVPTNNTPINSGKKSFYVHQAVVKFKDPVYLPDETFTLSSETIQNEIKLDLIENYEEPFDDLESTSQFENGKNDDLTILLEQLTKITIAPLAEPESMDDNSLGSQKIWPKYPDPDYDVPRPHKPLGIFISNGSEIISSTEFLGRHEKHSDLSSPFLSIEPDSLETVDKKFIRA